MAGHPIIALWTTPRSRSTAFERMMIERGDHTVVNEPFSLRYYFSPERRSGRFGETEPGAVLDSVLDEVLAAAESGPVFMKDMAYHVTDALTAEFLSNFTNTYLVREPVAALSSLWRKWPDFSDEEAGYEALERAFTISGGPVIEADDLAADPAGIIEAWCAAVGIEYRPDALTWEPGMVKEWEYWREWYEGVADSTGFRPPSLRPGSPPEPPDERVRAAARAAEPVYETLVAHRVGAR